MENVEERKRAFLSNGIASALELGGTIEWFPCPRFDAPSVFSKILDTEKGGHFSVRPELEYKITTEYMEDSLVVKNEFKTAEGTLQLIDFMPIGFVSIIRLYKSAIPFLVDIKPVFEYGSVAPEDIREGGSLLFFNKNTNEVLELHISGKHAIKDRNTVGMEPGEGFLFLSYYKDIRYRAFVSGQVVRTDPYNAFRRTFEYWHTKVGNAKRVKNYGGPYIRSLATMLGLIYSSSGAPIAASTTSIPETIGGSRNWDYRYAWIRDSSYAAEALAESNLLLESRNVLSFLISLINVSSKSFEHPLYCVDGTEPGPEKILDWLSGNRNSKPVRIGNAAYLQTQADSEGNFINALYTYYKNSKDRAFIKKNWWAVEAVARYVKKSWKEPTISLWEERIEKRHFTHASLMNWVAMDRACRLGTEIGEDGEIEEWAAVRDNIRKDIMHKSVKNSKIFVHFYGGNEIDSSLLTIPLYGFVEPENPIFLETVERIENGLKTDNGMLLRYRSDYAGNAEHPFILVNTWMCRVYTRLGRMKEAKGLIERVIRCSNDLGLLSEHVSSANVQMGNFPQLFSHAGLAEAILEYNAAFKGS